MLAASASFALMALFVKRVSVEIPEGEVVLFRSLVVLAISVALAVRQGGALAGVARGTLLVRGLVGCASMFAYFFAIHHLKLGDAVLITYLSPLFVSLLAPFVLRERVPRAVWLALAFGFGGVAIVARGQPSAAAGVSQTAGVVAGLTSAVLAAMAYVSVRRLSRTDAPVTIVVWFSAVSVLLGAAASAWKWVTPSLPLARDLLLIGIFAAIAQLLMTKSYAISEAARVSIYGYATPVLSYGLGLLVLRELPGWSGIVGTAFVLIAGVIASVGSLHRAADARPREA